MRPKDLKPVFTFANRTILLQDGVFYLPDHFYDYHLFPFPSWSEKALFGNGYPVVIEFCAGNGGWIEERAKQFPLKNWVAVEKRFDRVRKIWCKRKNHELHNLFAVCGEGERFATHFVQTHSVAEVYINFPDPWPKRKHAKNRIMKASFIAELARIVSPAGTVTFVTDDLSYMEETQRLFAHNEAFALSVYMTDPTEYGSSYFDSLWRTQGRTIYYAQYCRR